MYVAVPIYVCKRQFLMMTIIRRALNLKPSGLWSPGLINDLALDATSAAAAAAAALLNRTCLACGEEVDLRRDVPVPSLRSRSLEAVHCLTRGRWHEGMRHAADAHAIVQAAFGLPIMELTEIQVSSYIEYMYVMFVSSNANLILLLQISIWKCMWLRAGNIKAVKH